MYVSKEVADVIDRAYTLAKDALHDHTVMPGLPYIDPCLFPCLSLYCHDPLPASFPAVPICSAGTFSSLLTV